MTALTEFEKTGLFSTRLLQPKEEPLDYDYIPSQGPLDLCIKPPKLPLTLENYNIMTSPYCNFPRSPLTCLSPAIIYQDKDRRSSFDSSTRSNSSSESPELSSTTGDDGKVTNSTHKIRVARPFKAFPKDPVSFSSGPRAMDFFFSTMDRDMSESYKEFRDKMMDQVQTQNSNTTNKNMRRTSQTSIMQNHDPSYLEKRKKNNEAAKRSRDARRAKEDEIAIRCAFLEREFLKVNTENTQLKHENLQLQYRMRALEDEIERIRKLIYPSK